MRRLDRKPRSKRYLTASPTAALGALALAMFGLGNVAQAGNVTVPGSRRA
jgi:hypothetical protein